MADDQEKTEDPTGKRLSDARNEGNVAKSRELPTAMLLLASALFFYFYAPFFMEGMQKIVHDILSLTNFEVNKQSILKLMDYSISEAGMILLPFFLMTIVVAFASNIIQVGWLISTKALAVKLERLNPIKGFGKFFSKKSLVELIKSLIKIFLIGFLAFLIVKGKMPVILTLADADINDIIIYFAKLIYEILWKIALFFLIVAIADFAYQKYQHKQDLKMSKQEVKDEYKQMEGDPKIKGRIREIQREMARKRMMEDVPQSDVVVTNPTHYSVAIRYSPGEDRAPIVLAKGQRLMALKIREIAKEHGILIHEAPPIARSLYNTVDIGDEIPENLYKAVAEILAMVEKFRS